MHSINDRSSTFRDCSRSLIDSGGGSGAKDPKQAETWPYKSNKLIQWINDGS